jgi:predicted enzyme related to lactoylglutathione lyase
VGVPGPARRRAAATGVPARSRAKAGKVKVHLDVTVEDIEAALELVWVLGGRFTGERHDYDEGEGVVVVMADPEGHEFCLVQYY